jgi:ppGpp synthetase/RelA/SpoT-type nucleotidyltranferase
MTDGRLEDARAKFLEQKELLGRFKAAVLSRTQAGLDSRSIEATLSGRVKTIDSLIKKLLLKPHHSYDSLSDKVGVRVICGDRTGVCEVIRDRFTCLRVDDKAAGREPDELGYPGVHFDVTFPEAEAAFPEFVGLQCEIQVRTYGEHMWCEVSHKLAYKAPLKSGDSMPKDVRRRLMLTVGMLEMAEMNLADVSRATRALPAFAIGRAVESLEKFYYQFTTRRPNRAISFTIMEALLPLYSAVDEMEQRVSALVSEKQDVLTQVFERNEQMDEPHATLFFQPEVLAIRDLMERKRELLFETWRNIMPEAELFDIATEFGYSFDDIRD